MRCNVQVNQWRPSGSTRAKTNASTRAETRSESAGCSITASSCGHEVRHMLYYLQSSSNLYHCIWHILLVYVSRLPRCQGCWRTWRAITSAHALMPAAPSSSEATSTCCFRATKPLHVHAVSNQTSFPMRLAVLDALCPDCP